MDRSLNLPYGTQLCIPELNQHYRRRINVVVRDTNTGLDGSGTSRVEICVRSESDSYDLAVNRPISLIIEKWSFMMIKYVFIYFCVDKYLDVVVFIIPYKF